MGIGLSSGGSMPRRLPVVERLVVIGLTCANGCAARQSWAADAPLSYHLKYATIGYALLSGALPPAL